MTYGVLQSDGSRLQCHICGDWFVSLGSHVWQKHGSTADAYRAEFGLMAKTKLWGDELRKEFGERNGGRASANIAPHKLQAGQTKISRPKGSRMSAEEQRVFAPIWAERELEDERNCETCGDKFVTRPSRPTRFCSPSCAAIARGTAHLQSPAARAKSAVSYQAFLETHPEARERLSEHARNRNDRDDRGVWRGKKGRPAA